MPYPVGDLRVDVPTVGRHPIENSLNIPNINSPLISVRPLVDVSMMYDPGRYANFSAQVNPDFLTETMLKRPRPHLAGIHLFFINDDIAAVSWCAALNELYGERGRFVEVSAGVNFHREAFLNGTLRNPTRATIEVDSFSVNWEVDRLKARHDVRRRGIWRLEVLGHKNGEPIKVVSLVGEYFRQNQVAHA